MKKEEIIEWVKELDSAIDDFEGGEAIVDDFFTELSENPERCDISKEMAFYCAREGYVSVLDLIIVNQLSMDVTMDSRNLMDIALEGGYKDMIEYLQSYDLQPSEVNEKDSGGCGSDDSSEYSIDEQPQKRAKWSDSIKKGERINVR